jgi:ATP-dependent DNA helicase RecG
MVISVPEFGKERGAQNGMVAPPEVDERGAQSRAQSRAQSKAQLHAVLTALTEGPLSAADLVAVLELGTKTGAFKRSMKDLLEQGCIAYTIPDKPTSRLQKYRLTDEGRAWLKKAPQ